jgi:hypothetical protein
VQIIDADGDGRSDLLVTSEALSGYFPLHAEDDHVAGTFRRYAFAPSFDLEDREVRLFDLDGDGITDAIRSGARLECFFNHPESGWDAELAVERRAPDIFPDVVFSDPRVRVADMTGDGLQDIVLVHDGLVQYWPQLGHAR